MTFETTEHFGWVHVGEKLERQSRSFNFFLHLLSGGLERIQICIDKHEKFSRRIIPPACTFTRMWNFFRWKFMEWHPNSFHTAEAMGCITKKFWYLFFVNMVAHSFLVLCQNTFLFQKSMPLPKHKNWIFKFQMKDFLSSHLRAQPNQWFRGHNRHRSWSLRAGRRGDWHRIGGTHGTRFSLNGFRRWCLRLWRWSIGLYTGITTLYVSAQVVFWLVIIAHYIFEHRRGPSSWMWDFKSEQHVDIFFAMWRYDDRVV